MVFNLSDLKQRLGLRLSRESYEHSLRTQAAAERLAELHDLDVTLASAAGLLHDYAKDMVDDELVRAAREQGIPVSWVDEKNPYLLHAPVGARLVAAELGIDHPAVLDAIAKHTYGARAMSDLDRAVYLADAIEPGRDWTGLDDIRRLAEQDLGKAFALAYLYQLNFVLSKRAYIHPVSIEVWNRLISEREEAGNGWL